MGVEFSLPPWQAWWWCCFDSFIFVLSLYLVPKRLRQLPRSDPSQIKARYAAVASATLLAVGFTLMLARPVIGGPSLRKWIGVHTTRFGTALILPTMLTSCLFLGPLATMVWMARETAKHEVTSVGHTRPRAHVLPWHVAIWRELAKKANISHGRYVTIRNLLVGPIAEEVVFRGCSIPLLLGAGVERTRIIWLSPLMFGFAHLHHAYEWLRQGHAARTVAIGVIFQMIYTSLFGAYAVFVQMRTGHLASSILVHALCNFMGVPDLTFNVAPGNSQESTPTSVLYQRRIGIWCFYCTGVCLFCVLLFPLTSPGLYGSILWS